MGIAGIAWRSIIRRPFRNIILALCMAILAGMLAAVKIIDTASAEGIKSGIERLGADLVAVPRGLDASTVKSFISGNASLFYMPDSIQAEIKKYDFIERTSPQLFIKSLSGASCCTVWDVFLIGFDPESDFTIRPWLIRNKDQNLKPDEIIVGSAINAFPGMKLRFYGLDFRVAGMLDPGGMGLDTSVFIPLDAARRLIAESGTRAEKRLDIRTDRISAVMIKLKPERSGGIPGWKAAYELEMGIPAISIVQPADITVQAQKNLTGVLKSLYAAGYASWPVMLLLMGLVFFMSVRERQAEIGLFRAVGASRIDVFKMVQIEAAMVSGIGALAGVIASVVIALAFMKMVSIRLETPLLIPQNGKIVLIALASFASGIMTGIASALIPAVVAGRKEPYEAIRKTA